MGSRVLSKHSPWQCLSLPLIATAFDPARESSANYETAKYALSTLL